MKNLKVLWIPLLLCLSLYVQSQSVSGYTTKEHPRLSNVDRNNLDRILESPILEEKLAGVVALLAVEGEVIYYKSFGMQNIEEGIKMQENSSFQIASMTKPVTTVALLMLMEEGKLKLDDPITKYIPSYNKFKVVRKDGSAEPLQEPLTIKHFLMHTSGLPNGGHQSAREKLDWSKINSLKDYTEAFADLPILHQPEEHFTYGLNTNVIGRVVEIVSGLSLEEFFSKNIFEPLGMEHTYYFLPDEALSRFASFYSSTEEGLKLIEGPTTKPVKFPMGNGGLSTTASDYFKFAQMLVNGGTLNGIRILKEKTVKLMTSNLLPEKLRPLQVGETVFPELSFGLGVAVSNEKAATWQPKPLKFNHIGNLPQGSFLWPGITNTYWWGDPQNKVVGVLLSQSSNPPNTNIFQEFHQAFYSDWYKIPEKYIDLSTSDRTAVDPTSPTLSIEERKFLVDHLQQGKNDLLGLLTNLTNEQLDFKINEDKWSIVECIEHLAVAEESLWNWATAGLKDAPNPERKKEIRANEKMIIARLSDRKNQLEAPKEVRPIGRYANIGIALVDLVEKRNRIIDFIKHTEKDLRSYIVDHHVAGPIDSYMAITLLSAHLQRHIGQIKEITEHPNFPAK